MNEFLCDKLTVLPLLSNGHSSTFNHNPASPEKLSLVALCGSRIGIFLELGLDWRRHFAGDGTTTGEQQIYDRATPPW
jgi:hypothetical protein